MKEPRKASLQNDITRRAILIGLILVVVNAYWVGIASELWYQAIFTFLHPFPHAIFNLSVLIVLSFTLRRISRRFSLSPAELLVIYIMVVMVSTISGHTMMAILMGTLAHPYWFASPENEWKSLFWRYIPSWFTTSDTKVLRGYLYGESTFHTLEHLRAWAIPILTWSLFIFFLYLSYLCIASILRKQWAENEKLSYPIVQLPLAMATDRRFFRSNLLWIGFAISGSIRVIDGIHDLFPVVPQIPHGYWIRFAEKPWNAMGSISVSFNLAVVGLTYFMPLDLAFSSWFFFWLSRIERAIASSMGVSVSSLYINDRVSGAWIGIGVLAIWISRRHLISFLKHILGLERMDDSREPFGYRTITFMFLGSFAFLGLFCYFAGMSLWAILVFFALHYMLALAISRVRAELGPPYHEVIGINPRGMMVEMFGSRRLRGGNLTVLTFLYAFDRCHRSHSMPSQVEALKIGERTGMNNRRLFGAMALAIGVGAVATLWSYLQIAYKYGTLAKMRGWVGHFGWESFNPLQRWLQYPQGTNVRGTLFMLGGFLFVFFLYGMRSRFLWWPLHPSGYVISGAMWGGLCYFWFPVVVSWLVKLIILRYFGLKVHRRGIPFFFGLILGDYIPRSILSILSLILNLNMPSAGAGHTL